MLFLIFFLMFSEINCTWSQNGGSTIFYKRFVRSKCWNELDIAKLRARQFFEQIVPYSVPPERMNSKYIRNILHYYQHALDAVQTKDERSSSILKEALADTIGGHLRSDVLPTARFAYYAGYIPYHKVRDLHDFYENIRKMLNTQGLGWRIPRRVPKWSNLTVAKILIGEGKHFNPCGSLVIKRDSLSCMHLTVPTLDDDREPSAILLPLKTGGLVSLTSPDSENILLKYYTTASRCILNSSTAKCRHKDFVNFNNDMWHWMKRNVAPHLVDEKLYTAYGGVLRIAAAVQSYGKGLTRRNLFDMDTNKISKWQPWKMLTDTHIYINTDWTPHLYVGVVMLAGLSIFLMQMCYNFIFGDDEACPCGDRPKQRGSEDVEYGRVESTIPAMLPSHQSAVYYSDQKRTRSPLSKTKTSSLGSFQTQKVFDLNENTEKLMAVIMSDKEDVSSETESTSKDAETSKENASGGKRSASPPKIETDVSQVQLSRGSNTLRRAVFSPCSLSRSDETCRRGLSDSQWSGSSSSEQSLSSTTSKSVCRQSRSSRDLAWARRVVSKHSSRKSTSGTELDYTSYTTPPSRR